MSITLIIIVATVIASLAAFSSEEVKRKLIFNPFMIEDRKEWWRFLTSGFIHADSMHLLINMFVLYSFGQAAEFYYNYTFGIHSTNYFSTLYIGGIIVSSIPSFVKNRHSAYYNSLGASGAVSAVMFTTILFAPWTKLYIMGVLPVPGIILGPLYLYLEYRLSQKGGTGVNHDAHIWGAIFGVVYTIIMHPKIIISFIAQLTGQ